MHLNLAWVNQAQAKTDNMCNTRILCQTNRTTVSQCMECGMYFIWHNNVLLNFGNKEFYLFLAHIKSYVFHERAIPFPDGEERLIMQSPANEINLAFAEDEWEDLKDLLTESAYLGNVYDILKGK